MGSSPPPNLGGGGEGGQGLGVLLHHRPPGAGPGPLPPPRPGPRDRGPAAAAGGAGAAGADPGPGGLRHLEDPRHGLEQEQVGSGPPTPSPGSSAPRPRVQPGVQGGGSQHPPWLSPRPSQGTVPQRRAGAPLHPRLLGWVAAPHAGASPARGGPGRPAACLSFPNSHSRPTLLYIPRTVAGHRPEGQPRPSVSAPAAPWMPGAGAGFGPPGWMLMSPPPISRAPVPAQELVRALYAFQSRNSQELSVRMGETLQVETRGVPPHGCSWGGWSGDPHPAYWGSWKGVMTAGFVALGAGPAEEVVAGAGQPGGEGLRPQQHPGAPGAGVRRGGPQRQPGGCPLSPPCMPTTRRGWQGVTPLSPPSPLSPAPGQPPQAAPQLPAGGGDGLAEGQGLRADVGGPSSPPTHVAPSRGGWEGGNPCSPLIVCPSVRPSAARCSAWGC